MRKPGGGAGVALGWVFVGALGGAGARCCRWVGEVDLFWAGGAGLEGEVFWGEVAASLVGAVALGCAFWVGDGEEGVGRREERPEEEGGVDEGAGFCLGRGLAGATWDWGVRPVEAGGGVFFGGRDCSSWAASAGSEPGIGDGEERSGMKIWPRNWEPGAGSSWPTAGTAMVRATTRIKKEDHRAFMASRPTREKGAGSREKEEGVGRGLVQRGFLGLWGKRNDSCPRRIRAVGRSHNQKTREEV